MIERENYESLGSNSKYPNIVQKVTLLLVFIVTCIINGLTGAGKIGKSQGDISNKYSTLITPPGYAFTIWAVIYFLWAAWIVLQMFPNKFLTNPDKIYSNNIRGWFR